MKDQHTKITGYRDLTQAEIDEMNQCKELGEACRELISTLRDTPDIDTEALNIGKIKLKEGIMWLVRSVAKPGGF